METVSEETQNWLIKTFHHSEQPEERIVLAEIIRTLGGHIEHPVEIWFDSDKSGE